MFGMHKARKPLSEVEHVLMDSLWELGPLTSDQLREALAERHPMKESTARTFLKRLEQKGYVRHRVEGRTYVYSGVEAREHAAAKAVRQVIDRMCGGSVEKLLVGMVENEVVDVPELQRLAQRIARRYRAAGG